MFYLHSRLFFHYSHGKRVVESIPWCQGLGAPVPIQQGHTKVWPLC